MLNSFTLYEASNATELTQRLHYNITITSVQEKENKGEEKRERGGEHLDKACSRKISSVLQMSYF